MEEAFLTLAFTVLALFGIIIRLLLPLALIIIGAKRMRKNKAGGKPLFIGGIIYLTISVAYFIYSAIMYGL